MTLVRSRRRARAAVDYWPGFVDALSALLLGLVFLLTILLLAQGFLSRDVAGRDSALRRLDHEVTELSGLLAAERAGKAEAEAGRAELVSTLQAAEASKARMLDERSSLLARVAAAEKTSAETTERASATFLGMAKDLDAAKQGSAGARAEVETLSQQIAASRAKLSELEEALAAAQGRDQESRATIADLEARLDRAHSESGPDLDRYRSDFFGRLREVLGDRPGIRVAGDRFVVQAEVLFASGRAILDPAGRAELDKIASALIELDRLIPKDISWVLRVDGHTDRKPILSRNFDSNWSLSSARATAVVQYLITKGAPPERLAAAGFGEFHPIETGDGDEVNRRNRRIELKITEK